MLAAPKNQENISVFIPQDEGFDKIPDRADSSFGFGKVNSQTSAGVTITFLESSSARRRQ
jgi:hypothetical protein